MGVHLRVEIWSDVVCPWCYIGKRRFERAIEQLAGEIEVEAVYRPFQLDPGAPIGTSTPVAEAYARKFGGPERAAAIIDHVTRIAADEGLEFRLDRAWRANTLAAHRLLWLAERPGTGISQTALEERLLRAYFTDGLDIGDTEVLIGCAAEVGLDAEVARSHLAGDEGMTEVSAMLSHAHELGISGVPAYVIGGLWTVPGAQDPEVFVQVLRRVRDRRIETAQA